MKLWLTLLSLVFAGNTFGSIIGYNFVSNWGSPTIQGETALGFSEWTDSVDEVNAPGGTEVPNSTDPFASNRVLAAGSSPPHGSSRIRRAGSCMSARTIRTFRRSPVDKWSIF